MVESVKGESSPSDWRGRLKAAREEAGYSVRKLAEELREQGMDISGSSVSQYETGGSTPKPEYFRAFGEVCGVNPTWILTGREPAGWNAGQSFRNGVRYAAGEMTRTLVHLVGGTAFLEGELDAGVLRELLEALERLDPGTEEPSEFGEEGGSRRRREQA